MIGTSIGAVNGAAIVQGVAAEELERVWLTLREHHIQGAAAGDAHAHALGVEPAAQAVHRRHAAGGVARAIDLAAGAGVLAAAAAAPVAPE
ncbi:MAG: hypothetical protein M5R40_11485 [Anaerolineae bacterium]|nr:hypothetical protein [Anaerolineae bacterium]